MAPDPLGALLMTVAGIAWGFYSLLGRGSNDPLAATANNFIACVPLVLAANLYFSGAMSVTSTGVWLAITSGAITSGMGYVIWYAALPGLTATRAATVQLMVPAISAFGGVVLLSEPVTLRLLLASAATLGGIAIVLTQRATAKAS
jgi:drug/metabolite transporter (DMT)-like permease